MSRSDVRSRNSNGSRPASANAWGDEQEQGAMSNEAYDHMYDEAPVAVVNQPETRVQVREEPGCFDKFKSGIRSLWATRDTEDTSVDRELHVKTTLRELIVYIVFLVILCVVTFGMTSPTMYYYTKVMSELFLDSQFPDTKNTFRGLTTMQDAWRFLERPFIDGTYWEKMYNNEPVHETGYIFYENKLLGVPRVRQLKFLENPAIKGLHWEKYYNGKPVEDLGYIYYENKLLGVPRLRQVKFLEQPMMDGVYWEKKYNGDPVDETGFIYFENKLLGVPRIRQLKVRNNSCTVHDDFKNEIKTCYDSYAESIEDKADFGPGENHTCFSYKSEKELDGSSHWGRISHYGGGGFVCNLGNTSTESRAIVAHLKQNLWLDRGTRALFVDFTVYNANINLFCVVRLLVEFPATGGAISSWNFRTVKLIRYVTIGDYFVLACECIFVLFIFYYLIEESIEIKRHKLAYFKSFWNILDILVIGISLVCIGFNVYRSLAVTNKLDSLLQNPDGFPDFEFLSYWQVQFNSAVAITVFLAWVKVFKYISFNKTMTQLSSTLAACAKDLAGFAVMFFIIFLAFAQLGYLIFGTQVKDFSSFDNAVFTLFRIILGDFNFHELEEANRVLGPLYFILYVFFVFFVLLNMFLAIINDTYSEVKADISNQKNEFEMGDYFKKGYNRMLDKLNFKRDKIVDIQSALQNADADSDKEVDFDEWRRELKARGYAEAEIEAVFAKYDTDGDRVLNEKEQKAMQAELRKEISNVDKEYADLQQQQRPGSGKSKRDGSRLSFNDSDSDDEESGTKSSRTGRPAKGVSYEEFTLLQRRVDRMEHSIGSIVSKIDAVLVKLEAMERAKGKRRETMSRILDSITESDGNSDDAKREQMEKLVREELERWDSESSISNRGQSPSGSSGKASNRLSPKGDFFDRTNKSKV